MFRKENNYSTHQKSPFLDMLIKIASCSFSVCAVNADPMALQDSRAERRRSLWHCLGPCPVLPFPLSLHGSFVGYSSCKLFREHLHIQIHNTCKLLRECLHLQIQFAYDTRAAISLFPTWPLQTPRQDVGQGFGRAAFGRMENTSLWEHRDCSCGGFAMWN